MYYMLKSSSISSVLLLVYSCFSFSASYYLMLNNKCFFIEWIIVDLSSCSMKMSVVFDQVSLSFSGIVCLISGCVMIFSSSYMSGDVFLSRFIWLVMLFVLSMNLLVFIPSLPALLLGWDGLGIVSFALVVYYQNNKSLSAGMLTILANRIGDVMILVSIGMLVILGYWNIMFITDFCFTSVLSLCILIAGMTKSAQMPFSSWLPAAMAAPTPVSALVHSSTLVTAGVFLLIRFYPILEKWNGFKSSLLVVAVLTMLMAGIGANFENDLKKIVALSTLSQLGVMMMSLALGLPMLALFHLYTHALFKALLFLCAGAIIHSSNGIQDIRMMNMMYSQLPITSSCMNVANLSLCGGLFLSGFYSKDLILEYSLFHPISLLMIMMIMLATGLTITYTLRVSYASLWSVNKSSPLHSKTDYDFYMYVPMMILSFTAVTFGAMLQCFCMDFELGVVFLPSFQKFMVLAIIFFGVVIGSFIWKGSYFTKVNSKVSVFYSLMWFLVPLSTYPLVKVGMVYGSYLMKSIDQGWVEVLGGQGMFKVVKTVSENNQNIQLKVFNFLVIFMISIISVMLYMVSG
uniref:NADH-ubiquinone oxidoreductase chain 5 n=1 Tax=Rivularia auriculata TaxID=2023863 RepID=A0A7G6KRE8_9CAEN|nr:NADH dehydrogenase subunit 5 [Rivularia auriculata]YP_010486358.1 NADH dehydrogenase subunit 5 [Rivularia globosa]QNC70808.1 NADH dehydrogenase subunit 5 [Rivularia auriculata]UVW93514.1 NADH dehydrogenase subunit 5 [Rivularia globosa]UVW93553.1 NADH dehydrogenase subunit 5 [Rivularia auriculata]